MNQFEVIKRPLVTEKSMAQGQQANRYLFAVDVRADKQSITDAVEKLFKVHVIKVNTSIVRGKIKKVGRSAGKRPNWKKAFVTLKEGEKIELFEGV
jgi:large subunit ribosomal protein L23